METFLIELSEDVLSRVDSFQLPNVESRCILATWPLECQHNFLSSLIAQGHTWAPTVDLLNLLQAYFTSFSSQGKARWRGSGVSRLLIAQLARQLLLRPDLTLQQSTQLTDLLNQLKISNPDSLAPSNEHLTDETFLEDPGPCLAVHPLKISKKRRRSHSGDSSSPSKTAEYHSITEPQVKVIKSNTHKSAHPALSKVEGSPTVQLGDPSTSVAQPSEALMEQIEEYRQKLEVQGSTRGSTGRQAVQMSEGVVKLLAQAVSQGVLDWACGLEGLALAQASDEVLAAVAKGFVTEELAHQNCRVFVEGTFLLKAKNLNSPASRVLVGVLTELCKSRPELIIEGLVRPLLGQDAEVVGSAQCELCTRLVKGPLQASSLSSLLEALCQPGGCPLNDITAPLLTSLLGRRAPLEDSAVAALVGHVEAELTAATGDSAQLARLKKSVKIGTLLHGLISKYGPQVRSHEKVLREILGTCDNFMVKSALSALGKISNKIG
eukprot:CAMPEP_0117733304 /NCGR_PEP_ID=MMETSP0947-20121206/1_1 /TAXON_ID=44440 /ORGANISM="Chattonella subsalsa, Strain CCMP2191" /LENGTH=492 /DNA_ID=CAMNT_0005547871 /DNA_START=141 /DNA_END=1619 /DNA_ORIENTATION=+